MVVLVGFYTGWQQQISFDQSSSPEAFVHPHHLETHGETKKVVVDTAHLNIHWLDYEPCPENIEEYHSDTAHFQIQLLDYEHRPESIELNCQQQNEVQHDHHDHVHVVGYLWPPRDLLVFGAKF